MSTSNSTAAEVSRECGACSEKKGRAAFSKTQWSKRARERKCKACVGDGRCVSMQQNQQQQPSAPPFAPPPLYEAPPPPYEVAIAFNDNNTRTQQQQPVLDPSSVFADQHVAGGGGSFGDIPGLSHSENEEFSLRIKAAEAGIDETSSDSTGASVGDDMFSSKIDPDMLRVHKNVSPEVEEGHADIISLTEKITDLFREVSSYRSMANAAFDRNDLTWDNLFSCKTAVEALNEKEVELGTAFYKREKCLEERRVARLVQEAEKTSTAETFTCPICLEEVSSSSYEKIQLMCCGNIVCKPCHKAEWDRLNDIDAHFGPILTSEGPNAVFRELDRLEQCPLCRTEAPEDSEAVAMLRRHVERGKPWAMEMLGMAYLDGDFGIHPTDPAEGVRLLTMAANLGDSAAQVNLSHLYYSGRHVKKDLNKMRSLLTASAKSNNAVAQRMLGKFLRSGANGFKTDEEESLRMFTLSAAQGDEESMVELCKLYNGGEEPSYNVDRAIYWASQAAGRGNGTGYALLAKLLHDGASRLHSTGLPTGLNPLPVCMRLAKKGQELANTANDEYAQKASASILENIEKMVGSKCERCDKTCWCGAADQKLRGCPRCHVAFYCSKDCQTEHWRMGHKRECKGHWFQSLLDEKVFEGLK